MNYLLLSLGFLLAGCADASNNLLPVPRYLTKQNISLPAGEVKVKSNKQMKIAPELERMLGMNPMKFIEEWIDNKVDVTGAQNISVIITFPILQIVEQSKEEYKGVLKATLTFYDKDQMIRQINVLVNAIKGFDSRISYLRRKQMVYELLQELIASAHDSLLSELKKIN